MHAFSWILLDLQSILAKFEGVRGFSQDRYRGCVYTMRFFRNMFAKIFRIGKCVIVNRAFFAFSEPADEIEEERVFASKCFCAVSTANLLATSSRDFARLW